MFQEYAPFFGADDLDAMSAAFDAVWFQVCFWGIVTSPHQIKATRRKLAQVILAAACTGERTPERLKDVAFRAMSPVKQKASYWRHGC
jgi:hypothetical protein